MPSAFASAQVSALDVQCVHDKCKWKGTCGRLDGHLDTDCLHEPIKCSAEGCGALVPRGEMATHEQFVCLQSCPNSKPKAKGTNHTSNGDEQDTCNVRLNRDDLIEHLKNHCKLRLVHCPHPSCEVSTQYNRMPAHIEICPYAPVPCPRQCGVLDLTLKNVDAHKRDCPNEPVQCVHAPLGCLHVAPRYRIAQHEQDFEIHFVALSKAFAEQRRTYEQKLQEKNTLLEKLQAEIGALDKKLQLLHAKDVAETEARARAEDRIKDLARDKAQAVIQSLKCYRCGEHVACYFINDSEPQRNDSQCMHGISGTCSTFSHFLYGTTNWGRSMHKTQLFDVFFQAMSVSTTAL